MCPASVCFKMVILTKLGFVLCWQLSSTECSSPNFFHCHAIQPHKTEQEKSGYFANVHEQCTHLWLKHNSQYGCQQESQKDHQKQSKVLKQKSPWNYISCSFHNHAKTQKYLLKIIIMIFYLYALMFTFTLILNIVIKYFMRHWSLWWCTTKLSLAANGPAVIFW